MKLKFLSQNRASESILVSETKRDLHFTTMSVEKTVQPARRQRSYSESDIGKTRNTRPLWIPSINDIIKVANETATNFWAGVLVGEVLEFIREILVVCGRLPFCSEDLTGGT